MGTTAQKLQRVLDTKEGLKDTINTYLGQDITSAIPFKDYETYIKNFYGSLPKTDYAEGTEITLENCLKGKLDFENDIVAYGQTEQESTNGYQLIDLNEITNKTSNGITLTKNGNELTLSGTATANSYINYVFTNSIPLQTGDKIIVSQDNASSSNSGSILIRDTDNNTIINLAISNLSRSYTASASISVGRIVFYVPNGNTINHTFKVMLEKGDVAHDWEPYTDGPAPNPNYPFPIEVVTGEQSVLVRGKNYFDKSQTSTSGSNTMSELNTGVKLTYNGTTAVAATKYTVYRLFDLTNYIGKTIRFKSSAKASSTNLGKYYIGICDNNGQNRTPKAASSSISDGEGATVSFQVSSSDLTEDIKYLVLVLYSNASGANTVSPGDYVDYTDMILTIDEEDMTYEPYQEPKTYQLSLGDKELYEDSFISYENGDWYFNDNWYKFTLGNCTSLVTSTSASGYNMARYTKVLPKGIENINYSNRFISVLKGSSRGLNKFYWNVSTAISGFDICVDTDYTEESWNTFVANNNTYIIYKLETPIKTQITDTTLLEQLNNWYNSQSYTGTTIIESNGELPLLLKVRALKGE